MNTRSLPASPGLASLREQAKTWWLARTPRERQTVIVMAAVVAFFVVWSVFIQPAWRTISAAPAQLDQLDAQLQQMQRTAAESRSLRNAPPVNLSQAGIALKSATDRLGDKGKLLLIGDRATLTLNNADSESLRTWLGEARSAARARPVEAQLQRGTQGYSGTLVVNLGAGQ